MYRSLCLALPALIALPVSFSLVLPASAATQEECLAIYKTADVNANGSLTLDEDTSGYISAAKKAGKQLLQADTVSRDEFVELCTADVFAAQVKAQGTPGPAAGQDLGKGDITPATNPLTEEDARGKLTENGYREIENLKLDKAGVWRGSAVAHGQRQDVAIDAQGDMIAQANAPTPGTKVNPDSPAKDMKSPPAPVAREMAAAPQPQSGIERGEAGHGALPLWLFLLVGNAVGLVLLSSMTSGGTSAMGSGRRALT